LDLTVNTDFAQTDVDRQVLNLSRFSVFFPERRPFFLENASLFAVGRGSALQPFFSRRVGLDADGAPIPIHAGARVTSRSGAGQAGALLVHQGGAGGVEHSTIGVGRYTRNVAAGSRIGGLVAMRYDRAADTTGSAFNLTGAVDTYLRFSSSTYLQGMVSASSHDRPEGDGAAGYVWMASRGPRGYVGWVQEYVGRSYLPASGLVRRQDYLWTSPAAWLDLRPSWRPSFVRGFEPGTYVGVYHRPSDWRFLEAEWNIYPVYIRFHNDATIRASVWLHWQDHDVEFRPLPGVVIAPGRYSYQRAAFSVSTAPSSRVTANADLVTGPFFDGRLTAFTLSGSVVPSPHAGLFFTWTLNALRHVGLDDSDLNAWILAPEVRLALNPRVKLHAFYQYNSIHDVGAWNARFSWEFRPLSYLYLVYNDRQPGSDALPGAGPAERQVILKATWLRQF
jgi:hypothetical protein